MAQATPTPAPADPPRHTSLPWAGAALAVVGLLLQLAPQHHVRSTGFVLCLAPDCRSSSFTTTATCGGLEYLAEAPFIAVTLVLALCAQLVLGVRGRQATSRVRLGAGILTLLMGLATALGVLFHRLFQHLFDKLALGVGEVGVGLVVLSLLVIALLELVPGKPPGAPPQSAPPQSAPPQSAPRAA